MAAVAAAATSASVAWKAASAAVVALAAASKPADSPEPIGADAILLIAAALDPKEISALANFARSLQLEILLEVHNEKELQDNLDVEVDLLGVNNRDLKTFVTDIGISKRLAELIPRHVVKVSESGIEKAETIVELKKYGYQGFLMGQNFMQHSQPEKACKEFIDELNHLVEK